MILWARSLLTGVCLAGNCMSRLKELKSQTSWSRASLHGMQGASCLEALTCHVELPFDRTGDGRTPGAFSFFRLK